MVSPPATTPDDTTQLLHQSAHQGVNRITIKPGDGTTFPSRGDKVKIHYIGKDDTGKEFTNSYKDLGIPFETEIGTGKVISGWDQGILMLSKGEKARLTIPPDLAYGSQGYLPIIKEHATLIFDIELLEVIRRDS